MNLRNDVYYQSEYTRLYESADNQRFEFLYERGQDFFLNIAIKRPIRNIGSVSLTENYYDLETPYGYGGFLTNTADVDFINSALSAYREKCLAESIIAEFIRFHPFNDFAVKFGSLLDLCAPDRHVVIVDLTLEKDIRWSGYSSTARNLLRRAQEQLFVLQSTDIDKFRQIYNQTMDRNKASDFYYFDENYYRSLVSNKNVILLEVKQEATTVAMGFFMFGQEIAHYHLSANTEDGLHLNANYLMLDTAFDLGKEKGCSVFLLGGGRTNDPADPLLRFKQKFSGLTRDFYLGGKVYNQQKYNEYVNMWKEQNPGDERKYFLKYRLGSCHPDRSGGI
ncbi:MAG: GNAT family N-acetyltransferase [Candidatus Margulisbacteria bacterium]|nr:GNAT family N-acetyltransferase [Candidatus Margulisiibacteriota bacterium]